ncbi:MAG TPA: coenzyme F420-0:L-glutamate ligase [Candidatus Saccharimonadales bacterium]|nr:coenzyme F420-0:L-glutamate ligase [Candidatus Saccharimonadales bacterium]
MIVTPIKTRKVLPGALSIEALLDEALPALSEQSIVVVTSKVVSLCENNVRPLEGTDREALLREEAELYFVDDRGKTEKRLYNFTIKQKTLIPASGIDLSNSGGCYILWPRDPLASAEAIRQHLMQRDGLQQVGVIITDSTIGLSRWGTLGIAIGHSGFEPVKDYIGTPDLFGRTLMLSKSNLAGGLAAAAVAVMGEGAEQTPIAVIEAANGVDFWQADQTTGNPGVYYISPLDDDPFQPFFASAKWEKGGKFHD